MGAYSDMLTGGLWGYPQGAQSMGYYPQPVGGQPDPMGYYPQPVPLPVQPTYDFGAFARPQPQPVYRTPQMRPGGFTPSGQRDGAGGGRGGDQGGMTGNTTGNTTAGQSTLSRALYGGSLLDSRAAQAAAFGAGLAVPGLGMAATGIDLAQRVGNANAVNSMMGKAPMSLGEIASRALDPNVDIDSDVSNFRHAALSGAAPVNINVEAALKNYNRELPMNLGNRPGPGMNRGFDRPGSGSGGASSGAQGGSFGGRPGRSASGLGGPDRNGPAGSF